jgi:hypothetical protein
MRLLSCVCWLFDEAYYTSEVNGMENVKGKVVLAHGMKAYGGVGV